MPTPTQPRSSPSREVPADGVERPTESEPSPDSQIEPQGVPAESAATATDVESPRGRSRRHARRARLYVYAIVGVTLSAVIVALAASNTAHAKVSWVLGSSHVSLVWMVLSAVILGWLLGILTAAVLHRRTRAPH